MAEKESEVIHEIENLNFAIVNYLLYLFAKGGLHSLGATEKRPSRTSVCLHCRDNKTNTISSGFNLNSSFKIPCILRINFI